MNSISGSVHERRSKPRTRAQAWTALLFALTLLCACSSSRKSTDDLAVAKMSRDQIVATSYLPLNADKPGTPVDAQLYLVPGKYTIVEYFSPYDQTCANLEPRLLRLTQTRNDMAVRTVNINRPEVRQVDWQSPIVQYAGVQSLPFIQIYDTRQCLRAKGRPAFEQVSQWVQYL
ncbi:MAG: hypothetical protein U0103_04430 [Candidatus Obscuribacterales bacterium]